MSSLIKLIFVAGLAGACGLGGYSLMLWAAAAGMPTLMLLLFTLVAYLLVCVSFFLTGACAVVVYHSTMDFIDEVKK